VFWDGQFWFAADQAIAFRLWFTQSLRPGIEPFKMAVGTEFGLLQHTCRCLEDGLGAALGA
jgi:hypothetical protein